MTKLRLLGIYTTIYSDDVLKKDQMPCLNDFNECRLIASALYFITAGELVPLNCKDHMEAPLIENSDPASILLVGTP